MSFYKSFSRTCGGSAPKTSARSVTAPAQRPPPNPPTICLSIFLSNCIYLSIYPSFYLYLSVSIYPSTYVSICLSVYLSTCLSVYPSIYLYFDCLGR